MTTRRRRGQHGRGQALTELALILPCIALILLGIVELSGAFVARTDLSAATNQGARIGAVEGPGSTCGADPANARVDLDIIAAVLGGRGVVAANLQQIQVYRVNPDGTPDQTAVNTYTPPFTQTVGGVTTPVSTTGHFTWPPCQRHADEPSDSVGVALRYAYHPILALPTNPTFALAAETVQHLNPTTGSTPCPIPGIPTNVYSTQARLSEPPLTPNDTLTWNIVPGATSYALYANVNGAGFGASPVATVISNTLDGATQAFTYTGNTTYAPATYQVAGVNYCGVGQHSLPAANGQCALPVTPTILATGQGPLASTDLITYTAPWPSAPISDTYLVTQTSGSAVPPVTFTVPISPAAPLTTTTALTSTGTDPITYQMSAVNACGVVGPTSATITRAPAPTPTPVATATPVAPGAGLVGWWRFDEGAGATTADGSGQGHAGTLVNGPTWATGPTASFAGALTYNGTTQYVSAFVGSGTNLPAANAAQSISWWARVSANPTTTQTIMALTNGTSSAVQPGFRGGQVGVWQYGGAFLVSTTPPAAGAWHHYVYTYDPAGLPASTHRLYVDGALAASSTLTPQTATPTKLEFGRWTGGSEYFQGTLDDVRVYTRALSAAEVHILDTQP